METPRTQQEMFKDPQVGDVITTLRGKIRITRRDAVVEFTDTAKHNQDSHVMSLDRFHEEVDLALE